MVEVEDIAAVQEFLLTNGGFRLCTVFPADSPREVELEQSPGGLRVRLRRVVSRAHSGPPLVVELPRNAAGACSPEALRIEDIMLRWVDSPVNAAAAARAIATSESPSTWPVERCLTAGGGAFAAGRAGMLYRDLIPSRFGGRFVASHIKVPGARVDVPDSVHFHDVGFQMIYCAHGSVRLLYEGQGPAFWMEAGDCVLQPPTIRHRVLEARGDLEVVEVAVPAEHMTTIDHDTPLPSPGPPQPERLFGGQKFVWHRGGGARRRRANADSAAEEDSGGDDGRNDFGFGEATAGVAEAAVLTTRAAVLASRVRQQSRPHDLVFWFVLDGTVGVAVVPDDASGASAAGSSNDDDDGAATMTLRRQESLAVVVPPGAVLVGRARGTSEDARVLEVVVAANAGAAAASAAAAAAAKTIRARATRSSL